MTKTLPRLAGAIGVAALLVAPLTLPRAAATVRAQSVVEVDLIGNQFAPHEITIDAGTVVQFVNAEDQPGGNDALHTILDGGTGAWIAPDYLYPGDAFAVEYDTPGVYTFFCSVHTGMDGTITVN